jgi:hypothetical protein
VATTPDGTVKINSGRREPLLHDRLNDDRLAASGNLS